MAISQDFRLRAEVSAVAPGQAHCCNPEIDRLGGGATTSATEWGATPRASGSVLASCRRWSRLSGADARAPSPRTV
eukprot:gene20154-biopygen20580